jgi:hypothetical protein
MRYGLILGLLMALCASANATTVHESRMRHRLIVRHSTGELFFRPSSRTYARAERQMQYDDTPRYDDPSKFGGQSLGMDP